MIQKARQQQKGCVNPKAIFWKKGQINGESPQESEEGKERLKILKIQK